MDLAGLPFSPQLGGRSIAAREQLGHRAETGRLIQAQVEAQRYSSQTPGEFTPTALTEIIARGARGQPLPESELGRSLTVESPADGIVGPHAVQALAERLPRLRAGSAGGHHLLERAQAVGRHLQSCHGIDHERLLLPAPGPQAQQEEDIVIGLLAAALVCRQQGAGPQGMA